MNAFNLHNKKRKSSRKLELFSYVLLENTNIQQPLYLLHSPLQHRHTLRQLHVKQVITRLILKLELDVPGHFAIDKVSYRMYSY